MYIYIVNTREWKSKMSGSPRLLAALVGAIRRQLQFFTNAEVVFVWAKKRGKPMENDGILLDLIGFI